MLKDTVKPQHFHVGDIVVESYETEIITTFIVCEMEDKGNDTVYNMYILWSSEHWDELQGSTVVINASHINGMSEGPYTWKKAQ
jgi:hypothetical protein